MPAIEAAALCKTYADVFGRPRHQALRGLQLRVARGSIFGLIGQNGAGKTTFIKTLLDVVRPTSGSVRVLGGAPEDPAVRARIGYLPERLQLPAAWTPVAFLASVGRLKRVDAPDREIDRQLARVGLASEGSRRIGTFSKGMRQRLGLGAALLGRPDLLILDEPSDGIDPLGRADVRNILLEERARGATIFLNSHLLSETERICDRIGILDGGRLAREGTVQALCDSPTRHLVRFAPGAPREALERLGFSVLPREPDDDVDTRCDAIDARALNELLDGARAAGALVTEIRRDARDLEQVLADAVGSRTEVS